MRQPGDGNSRKLPLPEAGGTQRGDRLSRPGTKVTRRKLGHGGWPGVMREIQLLPEMASKQERKKFCTSTHPNLLSNLPPMNPLGNIWPAACWPSTLGSRAWRAHSLPYRAEGRLRKRPEGKQARTGHLDALASRHWCLSGLRTAILLVPGLGH